MRKTILLAAGVMVFFVLFGVTHAHAGLWDRLFGSREAPGVSDTEILVGQVCDLTGPLAFLGKELNHGAALYFRRVNDEGGVHGRKIRLVAEDDGYQPIRAVEAARKLLDKDRVFSLILTLGTATSEALFPIVQREGVPLIGPASESGTMAFPFKKYVFFASTPYSYQAVVIVDYIVRDIKAKNPRIAILYQDDDYGADGLRGFHEAVKEYSLAPAAEVPYKVGTVDFSSHVRKLREANPDFVILWTVLRETAAVLKEAHKLGWDPQFIGASPAADPMVLKIAGESAEFGKGFIAVHVHYLEHGDSAGAREYQELIRKYDPGHPLGFYDFAGAGVAKILVEGLTRAGKDLTREKLVKSLETLTAWESGYGPPLTYSKDSRAGARLAYLIKARGGRYEAITDWRAPSILPQY